MSGLRERSSSFAAGVPACHERIGRRLRTSSRVATSVGEWSQRKTHSLTLVATMLSALALGAVGLAQERVTPAHAKGAIAWGAPWANVPERFKDSINFPTWQPPANLARKIGGVYQLYQQPKNFRSVLYRGTGHEYLPEMKAEMLAWFQRNLPVK